MKTMSEVIIERDNEGKYFAKVEDRKLFVYPNYYNFSDVDVEEDFFDIEYTEKWITKVVRMSNNSELPKANKNFFLVSIDESKKIEIGNKKTISIPKNVDLGNADFNDLFLVEIEGTNFRSIQQAGVTFTNFDSEKITHYRIFRQSELQNDTAYFEKQSDEFKSSFSETFFKIGLNYDNKKKENPEMIEHRLPADTLNLLKGNTISNFHLELNKFLKFTFQKDALKPLKFSFGKEKKDWEWNARKFKNLCDKTYSVASSICSMVTEPEELQLKIDWRLALGLGTESVYETSITLHHIYGIPYIPASSVKGIVHHWAIDHIKEIAEKENSETLTKKWQEIKEVFGAEWNKNPVNPEILSDKNQQGSIIFFDAFPTSAPKIKVDIMNPHYPKWYDGSEPPTDFQNPVPIPFLTVEDCSFQFIIGAKKGNKESLDLLEKTKTWLTSALTQKGIGAKTAVGYGYMK